MGDVRDVVSADGAADESGAAVPAVQVTINVSGLATEETLALIAERVEASVAAAIDEARRFRTESAG